MLEAHANGLAEDVVRRCMWQLCKAMCFIHKQDIVYRDIKPENLLIDPAGTLKLCDFGFARKVRARHLMARVCIRGCGEATSPYPPARTGGGGTFGQKRVNTRSSTPLPTSARCGS